MQSTNTAGFFIEALGIDGQTVGKVFKEQAKLSAKWLTIFSQHLQVHGAVFDTPLLGPLSHISVRLTSANASALVTLSVHALPAASLLLLGGESMETDQSLGTMFVQSMRRTFPPQATGAQVGAFEQVLSAKDRPITFVVPIPNDRIDASDRELVKEIAQHLAGAFFMIHPTKN